MTIPVELEAQILRLYHAEKRPCGTIAKQLHVHRETVQRVLIRVDCPMTTPSTCGELRAYVYQSGPAPARHGHITKRVSASDRYSPLEHAPERFSAHLAMFLVLRAASHLI
nr:helix-turn-helix domain-containing protein [Burkholderia sp. LS-044]